MSSSQDVRYSAAKVRQGRDLANKMWNASRLVLLNAGDAVPEASPAEIEDRWILSRLERTVASVTEKLDTYDFSHAALEVYDFFWSEFCDWYLEIVKPRLYDGDQAAASNLLHALERVLALAHPLLPFVTEAIWAELPGRERALVVSAYPAADESRIDEEAEAAIGRDIDLTRALRRWRDVAGVPAGATLAARVSGGESPHELVARLARIELDGADGEALASVGPVEILASGEIDAERAREGIEARRAELRSEVERAERKLANEGFVAKAPPELVESEREKIERHRAELAELGEPT
jgi:valyl-tRNA synthetase